MTVSNAELTNIGPADVFMRKLLRLSPTPAPASAAKARSLMSTSIALSGLRCLVTYLLLPLLGPSISLGATSFALTAALGAVAVFFSVQSMRRFWMAQHRHRWAYTGFAAVIIGWVVVDLTLRIIG